MTAPPRSRGRPRHPCATVVPPRGQPRCRGSALRGVGRPVVAQGGSALRARRSSPGGSCPARPVPGTAAGWSATHRPARKGTAGCQNTPDTTYGPKGVLKKAGCNTAGDAYTALNEYMYLAVGAAGEARQGERPQDRARPRAPHATQTNLIAQLLGPALNRLGGAEER